MNERSMIIKLLLTLFCGLVFGSFITCASWRLPRDEDIVVKPSHCPKCKAKLGLKDLWPVFSWVTSKGKCRHCGVKIPARYPLIEIATASLFLLIYLRYGLTAPGIILALMGVALLLMIVVDLEHYIIPDQVQWALLALGVAWHIALHTPPKIAGEGFVLGAGIGLALHYGYKWIRKKDGLGFGDVKFLAVAGLWLGAVPMAPFLFFSGLFGTLFGLIWRAIGKGPIFPFGPALAASLFLCMAYPQFPNLFWQLGELLNRFEQ